MNAKIKAVKMWINSDDESPIYGTITLYPKKSDDVSEPVFVIDGSDIPKLVAQIGDSIAKANRLEEGDRFVPSPNGVARAIIADLGIPIR